jgi:hypothetical protein
MIADASPQLQAIISDRSTGLFIREGPVVCLWGELTAGCLPIRRVNPKMDRQKTESLVVHTNIPSVATTADV